MAFTPGARSWERPDKINPGVRDVALASWTCICYEVADVILHLVGIERSLGSKRTYDLCLYTVRDNTQALVVAIVQS